ncbi:MAG: hypothetical protein PHT33_08605 [bacterium]|nr:hypothetical protein [bacterium]
MIGVTSAGMCMPDVPATGDVASIIANDENGALSKQKNGLQPFVPLCLSALVPDKATDNALEERKEAPLLKLDADAIEYDPSHRMGKAEGNASMEYAGVRMTADSIVVDSAAGTVTAMGNVSIINGDRVISGSKIEYDLKADRAVIDDGRGSAEGIFFSGKKVEASRRLISIVEGTFTACSAAHPHYRLTAKSIEYYPDSSMLLRRVSVWIGRHRIFYLPQYRWNMKEEKNLQPLPAVSYDGYYGWHLSTVYVQQMDEFTSASADLKIGNKIGGRLNIHREESSYDLDFAVDRNRLIPDYPDYRVSYAPSLSIATKEFSLLKHKAIVGADYGSIHELPTDIHSSRAGMKLQARSGDIIEGDGEKGEYYLNAGKSWYGTDEAYSSIGFALEYEKKLDKHAGFELGYGWNRIWGSTPFVSDRLSAPHHLKGAVRRDIGRDWSLGLKTTYDLSVGDIWDTEFSLGRYLHCVEIRAVWRKRTEAFGLEIDLLRN